MNREIQFRAWVNGSGKPRMINWIDIDAIEWCNDKLWHHNGKYTLLGNLELMQFTGLTDKNGKEIYEGDIVLANGIQSVLDYDFSQARKYVSPIIQDSRHFEKRRSEYKVYWQQNFLQFSFMSLSEPKHSINSDVNERDFEVVGNIFESVVESQTKS